VNIIADIILIGVVAGTLLVWGGLILFFFGVRKDKKTKFKKEKSKSRN
jgi:hypothetical protein